MATAGCNRTAAHGGLGLRALFPSVMGGNDRIRSIRTPSSPASTTSRVLPCWSAVPFFRPQVPCERTISSTAKKSNGVCARGPKAWHSALRQKPASCTTRAQALDQVNQRSEEHTSELQSLMRISYAVFCLKKKKKK